jgi:hypothetical protein
LEDDLEVMYEISTDLVRSAPKSCDAYEAYRTAVRKIYRATEETDLSDDIWSLYVDGKDCTSTNPPVVLGDKLMLPIKTISDIFGYTVSYNSISEKMSIYDGSHCVKEAKLKNKIHFSSDGKLEHDIDDIFIVGNRAMVQADKLCDYLPLTAEIDREEKTVYINMAE